jgi:predicted permease
MTTGILTEKYVLFYSLANLIWHNFDNAHMSISLVIFPLYFFIVLGFIAGRWLRIEGQQIARLLIYLLTPLMISGFVAQLPFSGGLLTLPAGVFAVASLSALGAWMTGSLRPLLSYRPLLGAFGGMVNSGYFGIPIAVSILGDEKLGLYMLAIFGFSLFEFLVGVYLINRHVTSAAASFRKLIRLPGLYALMGGLIISACSVQLPVPVISMLHTVKSAYILLGMMMLGLALSQHRFVPDWWLLGSALFARFCIWPVAAAIFLFSFEWISGMPFQDDFKKILFILGLLPIAANVIAYSVDANAAPEKVAPVVLISTLLSPLLIWWCNCAGIFPISSSSD